MITIEHLKKLTPEGVSISLAVSQVHGQMIITLTPKGKNVYSPLQWSGLPEELAKEIPVDLDNIAVGAIDFISNKEGYSGKIKAETEQKDTDKTTTKTTPAKKPEAKKPEAKKPEAAKKSSGKKKPAVPAKKAAVPAKPAAKPAAAAPKKEDKPAATNQKETVETTAPIETSKPGIVPMDAPAETDTATLVNPDTANVSGAETEPAAADVKVNLPLADAPAEEPTFFND